MRRSTRIPYCEREKKEKKEWAHMKGRDCHHLNHRPSNKAEKQDTIIWCKDCLLFVFIFNFQFSIFIYLFYFYLCELWRIQRQQEARNGSQHGLDWIRFTMTDGACIHSANVPHFFFLSSILMSYLVGS